MKTAVVLLNMGGPSSLEAVEPFLFNLFNDKHITRLPTIPRMIFAYIMSKLRKKKAQKIYAQMGGKSPILENTQKQAKVIEDYLNLNYSSNTNSSYKTFVCMRYWHTMSHAIIQDVESYLPDNIILIPMYPHYSTTTTLSSIEDFKSEQDKSGISKDVPIKSLGCYFKEELFIKSHISLINQKIEEIKNDGLKPSDFTIMFTAHSLPEDIIKKGDPYQWQIQQSVEEIMKDKVLSSIQHIITYQSKAGPLKWLGPRTDDVIEDISKSGRGLLLVPISFVSEHSETLVELDIDYRGVIEANKMPYYRTSTLMNQQYFIESICKSVSLIAKCSTETVTSYSLERMCPGTFIKCACISTEITK